jgi:hypothetical protein
MRVVPRTLEHAGKIATFLPNLVTMGKSAPALESKRAGSLGTGHSICLALSVRG